jgi:hypothetical protein
MRRFAAMTLPRAQVMSARFPEAVKSQRPFFGYIGGCGGFQNQGECRQLEFRASAHISFTGPNNGFLYV